MFPIEQRPFLSASLKTILRHETPWRCGPIKGARRRNHWTPPRESSCTRDEMSNECPASLGDSCIRLLSGLFSNRQKNRALWHHRDDCVIDSQIAFGRADVRSTLRQEQRNGYDAIKRLASVADQSSPGLFMGAHWIMMTSLRRPPWRRAASVGHVRACCPPVLPPLRMRRAPPRNGRACGVGRLERSAASDSL